MHPMQHMSETVWGEVLAMNRHRLLMHLVHVLDVGLQQPTNKEAVR